MFKVRVCVCVNKQSAPSAPLARFLSFHFTHQCNNTSAPRTAAPLAQGLSVSQLQLIVCHSLFF